MDNPHAASRSFAYCASSSTEYEQTAKIKHSRFDVYRQQVHKVFVGVQPRWDQLQLDELVDVAVQRLQLLDVDFVLVHVVGHGLVDRDQVFEVHAQDGDLEACTPVVGLPVVVKVPAGGQHVRHLVQCLGGGQKQCV